MRIPLTALFEELLGISEITDERQIDELIAKLKQIKNTTQLSKK